MQSQPTAPVTPAQLRELAARAEALAADIDATHDRLRTAGDEPTCRAGFRLDGAAGFARTHVAAALTTTADDLARIRARSGCQADWGVCPEHGNTLASSGGKCWCGRPGCRRRWDHDRLGLPCTDPAAFALQGTDGGQIVLCAGHALDAHQRLIDARVTPLPSKGEAGQHAGKR